LIVKQVWLSSLVLFGVFLPGERPGAWNLPEREPVYLSAPLKVSITVFSDPHLYHPALGTVQE
jgi:hypothetical protein